MKLIIQTLIFTILIFSSSIAQINEQITDDSPDGLPIRAYLNLNNISTVFKNTGISDINITESRSGFVFPKGSGKTAVFISGFLWGTLIPGDPQPRVGGSAYREGLQGGKILSPGVPEDTSLSHVRIYRVRPDIYPGGPTAGVYIEAQDEGKSEAEIRTQYELDWVEWRAQDGAPFDDVDSNGLYDPNIDVPGVPGASQTIWFVANDLNPERTTYLYGAQPIGIEYQATYWAYRNTTFIDDIIFRKYKLINKSITPFNDMYITMFSDTDIGDASNDFAGCDTTLNMMYAYNAFEDDAVYDPLPPPAIGFDLLKGPTVQGNEGLPMTAAYFFTGGGVIVTDPTQGHIRGSSQFYNFMQGRVGDTGDPFIDPTTGLETSFALNGDPLTGQGWIDGMLNGPGDRRIGLASGPFNMAIGDTQQIVIAEIAALGLDRWNSLEKLKSYSDVVQYEFDNGFPLISVPRPPNPVVTVDDANAIIKLNWGTDNASVSAIENFNQDGYTFQGYNLYQLQDAVPYLQNELKIATYDIIDGIMEIQGIVRDPITGLLVNGVQQNGSDSGIERMFSTNYDYIENENMLVGKKYYYAVTAYTYNPDTLANPRSSETFFKLVEAEYYESLPGPNYGDSILVTHSAGVGDGNVYVNVDDPTQLTGDDYELSFHTQQQIRDENGDWVAASTIMKNNNPDDPDTLTGTTIDIAAVNGPGAGTTELRFHLDVVHHYYGWVDGVILTFPGNVSIIDSPPFEAGGGTVEPEIIGQEIHYGVTDNSETGNGIFHEGGEDWIVIVSTITTPIEIDWIAFDDGYAGGGPPETGTTIVTDVGSASRLAELWNLRNVTTGEITLQDNSIVNGIYLYPPRDDIPLEVSNPIADGFQVHVDVNYDPPIEFTSIELYSPSGLTSFGENTSSGDDGIRMTNYTIFGGTITSKAIDNFGVGTEELSELQQGYELRFTGVLDTMILPDGRTYIYVKEGGSMGTIFRIQGGDFTVHPGNTAGVAGPFQLLIPYEVWNVEDPENEYQVNLTFRDRLQDFSAGGSDPLYSWNLVNRMYSIIVNSPYNPTQVIQVDNGPDPFNDPAAWVLVHWATNYHLDDVVTVFYKGPVQFGIDKFTFSTPESVKFKPVITNYELFQNFPNPFNATTKIRFNIPENGIVKLEVFDILGQRVTQLLNTELDTGPYEVVFRGNNLASGVYFYMLNVKDKFFEVKKMLLLK